MYLASLVTRAHLVDTDKLPRIIVAGNFPTAVKVD